MRKPDVNVTVQGGVANVDVHTPGVLVEVRDFDVDGVDETDLWTNEQGDKCVRYFVLDKADGLRSSKSAEDLRRFAEDLSDHLNVSASFHLDPAPDGLHVLQINGVDFFFNTDGSGYDGWGRACKQR